jgi:hypothetical protein
MGMFFLGHLQRPGGSSKRTAAASTHSKSTMSPVNEPEVQPLTQEEVAEKPTATEPEATTTEAAEEPSAAKADEEVKEDVKDEAKTDEAPADAPSSPKEEEAAEQAPGKCCPSIPASLFCTAQRPGGQMSIMSSTEPRTDC